ncbi:MAG: tetratricopeptide repeat protein, partial [Planctomycetota bacterium]
MCMKAVILTMTMLAPLAAATLPATAPGGNEKNDKPKLTQAEKLFQDGRRALLTGDYDKAVTLLTQAVSKDKTKTSYRRHLARAYRYAGKGDQAEKELKAILAARSDHVEAGQLLAE